MTLVRVWVSGRPVCKKDQTRISRFLGSSYFSCKHCATYFLSPMPTVHDMKIYANQQYKSGGYFSYLQAKQLKLDTFRHRLFQIFQSKPTSQFRHLDIGCSAGYMIEASLEFGLDSYGVEFSEEAIAQASEKIRYRIFNGDANQMDFAVEDRFDLVTCFDIVEHLQDPVSFLTSIKKHLKPGGRLVLTTPDSEHFLAKIMGPFWPMFQPMQHMILFSKNSLSLSLVESGFDCVRTTPAYKTVTLEYLNSQLKITNPLLFILIRAIQKIVPSHLFLKKIKVNIGEFMTVAEIMNRPAIDPRP